MRTAAVALSIVNRTCTQSRSRRTVRFVALEFDDRECEPYGRVLIRALSCCTDTHDWWPSQSRFEVLVGALLVQQTTWSNAARSLLNLESHALLEPERLAQTPVGEVATLIQPSGFMKAKSAALAGLARWASEGAMQAGVVLPTCDLRTELLTLRGVGPETADAILLYGYNRPVFVADTYARRLFDAVGLPAPSSYEGLREVGMRLGADARMTVAEFQQFHALIDDFGKLVRFGQASYADLPSSSWSDRESG